MKTWIKKGVNLFVVSLAVACGSSQDPAAYHNELMTIINDNEKHITDMNAAMSAADYTKAAEVRTAWETSLKEQIEKVEEIDDFKGDDAFKKGILEGLHAYGKIVKDDYPKLIEIRSSGSDNAAFSNAALDNINAAFENAANAVNEAGSAFEKKYAGE